MVVLKKPYEISVWEDVLVTENEISYYDEKKIAVIGSDKMDGPNKVYEPVLTENMNGEVTLTFSLRYKYFDPVSEKMVINPFESFLVNERKIKLHYDGKWYDFIIKTHEESSEEYTWNYTAVDAAVLELSKTGYNLEFDVELNNNQGTAEELAKKVIENTDWQIGECVIGKQKVEEALYLATIDISVSGLEIINADDGTAATDVSTQIYLFYSYVANQNGKFVQFTARDTSHLDDKGNIIANNYRITNELTFENNTFKLNGTTVITINALETQYHGYRLVYGQKTTYDPVMKRTVDLFKTGEGDDADEAYRYIDYAYTTSDVVVSYVTNGTNFDTASEGSLQGWSNTTITTSTDPDEPFNGLNLVTYPSLDADMNIIDLVNYAEVEGFLETKFFGTLTSDYKNTIFNSGIEDNVSTLESISQGQKFVLRWRAGMAPEQHGTLTSFNGLGAIVAKYTKEQNGNYYVNVIDANQIILQFDKVSEVTVANNIISGGEIKEDKEGKQNAIYVLDGVAQAPSTKYIYKVGENEYIWDKVNHVYKEKPNDGSFLEYYYLVAEAQKSVSNSALTSPDTNIGIFFYLQDGTDASKWYYIEDVQLTKFYEDTDSQVVTIGNIPTGQSVATEHYYLKPSDGTAAEDVETYATIDAFASGIGIPSEQIHPVYNDNSEKYLTISESHSNCFNILQSIAETFEAWLTLDIEHDPETGKILLDSETKKPRKFVSFKEFAGNDNYAGFKYGINLNSIQRTVESDQIVTKLIVDQTQSDYNDDGFVSIQAADSNPSGESYILNFDYYYNKKLLDKATCEADLGKFNTEVHRLNDNIREHETERIQKENSLTKVTSQRNVYTTLLNEAKANVTEGLVDFQKATGQDYYEYIKKHQGKVGDIYFLTEDKQVDKEKKYYVQIEEDSYEEVKPAEGSNPKELGYYEKLSDLLENESIIDIIGKIYTNSSIINNYSGLLTNVGESYKSLRQKLYGNETYSLTVSVVEEELLGKTTLQIRLSDYIDKFEFKVDDNDYKADVNTKSFDIDIQGSGNHNITNIVVSNEYKVYNNENLEITTIIYNKNKVQKFKIKPVEEKEGLIDKIKEYQEEKDAYTSVFFNKYSRFIQEGTWNSTEYIDSNLYYLDALQISNTSAQPQVSYSINVVEISELEGLENYNFKVGDKTWVEDEEFFGWNSTLDAPAREEVIVSQVEWHLDEPENNVVTVQNYKTQFEDLFQRISATVQSVQYNEATYAKTSSFVDANGTIKQDTLLASLDNIKGRKYALTSDGSVYVNGENIYIQNLTNAANRVIINSEGIRISDDGGINWSTAISGRGIDAGLIYTGSLNTDEIVIGNRNNPSFRWDKYGISAFKKHADDTYDLNTYVRYDQYGLYGIKDSNSFRANSIIEVENSAYFGITWHGFFIKNSYEDGGKVTITSDNDFQVIDGRNQERIKIGSLGIVDGHRQYGIKILNASGTPVMETNDNGDITITGTINATAGEFSGHVHVGTDTPYIDIDGVNSWIQSSNYSNQSGWRIDKDGDAYFNNITARGAIKTAVFEYAEIQAVGGVFMFRPSSTIRSAAVDGQDLRIELEKSYLFQVDDWAKVSNYTTGGTDPSAVDALGTSGLTHIYRVKSANGKVVILENAARMVQGASKITELENLVGGALVSMGNCAYDAQKGKWVNSNNYGIGVNSSDNTIFLPRRAISLFETSINREAEDDEPKVTYNYRGILGTLPSTRDMQGSVNTNVYNNMQNTQGIYTDNMYIGNEKSYIAFYTDKDDLDEDNQPIKKLRVNSADITFTYDDGTVQSLDDHIEAIAGESGEGIIITVTSSDGFVFVTDTINTTLTAHVYQNGEVIGEGQGHSYQDITDMGYQINWYVNGILDIDHGEDTPTYVVNGIDLIDITVKLEDIPVEIVDGE